MKILIAHIHYPVSSGRYLGRALSRMGHDVRSLGPSTGRSIWGVEVPAEHVHTASYPQNWQLGQAFPNISAAIPSDAERYEGTRADFSRDLDWRPDLVITSDSSYTVTGRATVPHVLFAMDNHVRSYRNLEAEGAVFDAKFLAHSWGARIGEQYVYWSPPGFDPAWHTDLGIERDMDFCFVGYPYANRMELAAAFRAAGLRGLFALGLLGDAYNQAYNRARLAIVRSIKGDLTQRFLENMAQGCCVLADRVEDADKLGFVAGVDYWPYSTPAEAVREAKMLLETGRWQEIAANGKEKVRGHSWDVRANTLLNTIGFTQEWGYGMHPIIDLAHKEAVRP